MNSYQILICTALLFLFSCEDPYKNNTYQIYDEYPTSTYLDTRSEDFSMWIEILKYSNMYNAINQASEVYTSFVPSNDAVTAFYAKKGVSSINDLDQDYVCELVKYHIINAEIGQENFLSGGRLTTPNVLGDYLSVSFDESDGSEGGINSILLNKEAHVTELAIKTTNGLVYVIDAVMTPLVETLYDRLEQNGNYSIFKSAIDLCGWGERLNTPYYIEYSTIGSISLVKQNFTILIVGDDVFGDNQISDINGLISLLGASEDYTNDNNALNKYVEYHILSQSKYLEDLFPFDEADSTIIMDTQAPNEVLSTSNINGTYYINYKKSEQTGITLVDGKTDIKARNGMIHEVNGIMPVTTPDPMPVIWDFCEYNDIASLVNTYGSENNLGDCYQVYQTAEHQLDLAVDAITDFDYSAYTSASTSDWKRLGYLLTKANSTSTGNSYGAYKNDLFIVNLGYMGNVSMKTPVILKGKYKVELYYACAGSLSDFISGGSQCKFTLDDSSSEVYVFKGAAASVGIYSLTMFEEIEFDVTEAQSFKLVLMDSRATTHAKYRLMLDYVKFIPITE